MREKSGVETDYLMYEKFAWVDSLIAPPEEYHEETKLYVKSIKEHSKIRPQTLLHLGCGAGINDFTLKRYFKVTGIDINTSMLGIAKETNPDVRYLQADMRNARLGEKFDVVAIPDSIGYMQTRRDLKKAVNTAYIHLNRGGVFFFLTVVSEDFKENNFLYTGSKKGVQATVFENNTRSSLKNRYEMTAIYLIKRKGKTEIYTDVHQIGLFSVDTWLDALKSKGFKTDYQKIHYLYDRFMMEEGEYILTMFTCVKE